MFQIASFSFDSILWFCAGGKSFLTGIILLVLAALIQSQIQNKVSFYSAYLLYLFAFLGITLSATPLHPLFYVIWTILFIAFQIAILNKKSKIFTLNLLIVISLMFFFLELPWHISKPVSIHETKSIIVIGDSVSSGLGRQDEATWPQLLSEKTGIKTINLARAGATVSSALKKQIPQIPAENSLIFLEIGGNDLLNYNSLGDFEKDSKQMLNQLKSTSRQVVWLELPLLPQYYRYGRIQRKLAKEFQIQLIPKALLANVFGTTGATSDGIHLTQKGHELMANEIISIIHIMNERTEP